MPKYEIHKAISKAQNHAQIVKNGVLKTEEELAKTLDLLKKRKSAIILQEKKIIEAELEAKRIEKEKQEAAIKAEKEAKEKAALELAKQEELKAKEEAEKKEKSQKAAEKKTEKKAEKPAEKTAEKEVKKSAEKTIEKKVEKTDKEKPVKTASKKKEEVKAEKTTAKKTEKKPAAKEEASKSDSSKKSTTSNKSYNKKDMKIKADDKVVAKSSDRNKKTSTGKDYRNKKNPWQDNVDYRRNNYKKKKKPKVQAPPPERKKAFTMGDSITVKDLSENIGVSVTELIKKLMLMGVMTTINNSVDYETAALVASEFDIVLEQKTVKSFEEILDDSDVEDDDENSSIRPPIITVMGHVDHGKTSILDAIRKANVAEKEAGGITQHIGAYTIKRNGNLITFLDTPGHEAFTTMRLRGAMVTDIAVLVVAADDGVMPQTIEAINHAKAADVPILVAINKMDKSTANPERVKQELTNHGIVVEEWGGDTIAVPVSAATGEGIDDLLENILLITELQELKANPDRLAKGTVIEAELDNKGRGPVATILVQTGTLKVGDSIVTGTSAGRVRAMLDHNRRAVKKAGPSIPVEVTGLSEVPNAGDTVFAVKDDKLARQIAEERRVKLQAERHNAGTKVTLDNMFAQLQEGEMKELSVIVKADVRGSVEALRQALLKLSDEEVKINIIHSGVGAITETDVQLSSTSNAIIIGYNVRPTAAVSKLAEQEGVDIRLYRVIYHITEDIQKAMVGMLDPEFRQNIIGHAQVRAVFKVPGVGNICGSYVTDGVIKRDSLVTVVREGIVIYEGKIESLRRVKDDVKEVRQGFECGIGLANFNDIKEGDVLEASEMEEIKRG